jgi:hypothetical protein
MLSSLQTSAASDSWVAELASKIVEKSGNDSPLLVFWLVRGVAKSLESGVSGKYWPSVVNEIYLKMMFQTIFQN